MLFRATILNERQPLVPFFFSAISYFLPYFPLLGVARNVDPRHRFASFSSRAFFLSSRGKKADKSSTKDRPFEW